MPLLSARPHAWFLFLIFALAALTAFAFATTSGAAAPPTGNVLIRAVDTPTDTPTPDLTATATSTSTPTPIIEPLPSGAVVQTVADKLDQPVALAFDPSGRLFFIQRGGAVRLIVGDTLQASPVISFNVDTCNERGLVGLALDPNFVQNHYIYVQYTAYSSCGNTLNKVVRFVESGGVGFNPIVIFTSSFTGVYHTGNNIHFGPDGKLYVSVGDNYDDNTAQNVADPHGKMHRINSDGTIPSDNPVFTQTGALPSLYAMGLRNTFDFTFDTVVPGRIFATENGPNCDDEVNRIEAGYNYGWRASYPCDDAAPGGPDPAYNTIPPMWYVPQGPCCVAPTGIEVYTGTLFPDWRDQLFTCSFSDGILRHFYLSDDRTVVTRVAQVGGVTCQVDLQTAPDGALYYIEGGGKYSGSIKRITIPGPTPTPPSPTPSPTVCTITFADVQQGSVFYPFVRCLACKGILGGYPCGGAGEPCNENGDPYFRPGHSTTRGELAKIVSNAAGHNNPPGSELFQDVAPGSTFYTYTQRLANLGIINGYPCGGPTEPCIPPTNLPYFRLNNKATRGQITKIVANAAGLTDPPGPALFVDMPRVSTFYTSTQRLANLGVVSGYPCGGPTEPCFPPANLPYFRPNTTATRAQAAKIVANTFFPDCNPPR